MYFSKSTLCGSDLLHKKVSHHTFILLGTLGKYSASQCDETS